MSQPAAPRTIYLVGLRGTGKSTIGPLLAARLGVPFFDADVLLEQQAGRTIRDIFERDGETAFRDLEERLVHKLSQRGPAVIATGGGVVLRESNRTCLRRTGRVIWLTADAATLLGRLQGDPHTAGRRPDLGPGGRAEIEETMRSRDALYRSCADLVIDTTGLSPEAIVQGILGT